MYRSHKKDASASRNVGNTDIMGKTWEDIIEVPLRKCFSAFFGGVYKVTPYRRQHDGF